MAFHFCASVRAGVGEGVGVAEGVGVGVGVGFAALVVTTFTPLPQTFFFPWARQVYLKPFAIAEAPTLLQVSPVFTAAIEDVVDKPISKAVAITSATGFLMRRR